MVQRDPIYDPPGFWRQEARRALSEGRPIEDADSILCLTGPPDAFLEGISSEAKSVTVPSRPNFRAHYWQTRMWHCLMLELRYEAGNSNEAKLIPTGSTTKSTPCPACQNQVLYETKTFIAKIVTTGYVQTFHRRFRAAYNTLELPRVMGPIMVKVFPCDDSIMVAWRDLPADTEITTDSRVDLDNIAKVVLDAMQSEGGRPGLILNDRIVHILLLDRVRARRKG